MTLGVLAPFSQLLRDMVYVQLAYGWIAAYLCLLLFLVLRVLEQPAASVRQALGRPLLLVYALLVLLLFAGNMARGLVYWLVPVLGVFLLEARVGRMRGWCAAMGIASGVAAVMGCLLHFVLRARLNTKEWEVLFRTKSGLGSKLQVAWEGLPFLIGTPPALGPGWLSLQGSLAAIRVACFVLAAVALVLVWRRAGTARRQDGRHGGRRRWRWRRT